MAQQSNQNMQLMGHAAPQRMNDETAYAAPADWRAEGQWVYDAQGNAMGGGMQDMNMGFVPGASGGMMDMEIGMMPGMNGMQGMGQSGVGGGFAQSQRMKNPVSMEATHAPENNREAYMASLRSLLSRNVGYFIVCTFLVGTQQSVTWQGILHTVGSDYLVLYQPENERYVSCDLYALKFAQFHNVKSTPYCAGSRVWEGRSEP